MSRGYLAARDVDFACALAFILPYHAAGKRLSRTSFDGYNASRFIAVALCGREANPLWVCVCGKGCQMPLKLGMFLTPASNPQRPMSEVIDWNIDVIRMAERYGYDEVWVGSHLTSHYSRIACPMQVIARAIGETSKIMLGTGVTVLYQNHPLTIAAQLAQLDHMARGRINFGFGAGATVSDKLMFGVDSPISHTMMLEALEI